MKTWMMVLSLLLVATRVSAQVPPPPPPPAGGYEDDFDEGMDPYAGAGGDYGAPPPPPPPPSDYGSPPPPPPPSSSFSGGGGIARDSKRPSKLKLSDAQPEDFTDENFPELIESFDYPNADIRDVIKAISELTGKNFIIDNNVSGKITIVAPTRITVAEAWKAFLSALAVNNLTIVPSGKFLKIKNAKQAQKDSIETYTGSYYPNAEQMITRIIQIKHISAEELQKTLQPLMTSNGEVKAYQQTNSLILSDFGSNIERLAKIIRELDRQGFEEQLAVVPVRYAKARELADLITQIINKESGSQKGSGRFAPRIPRFRAPGQSGQAGSEQLSMVAPDERTNSLIVLGNKAGIEKIKELVKQLDIRRSPEEAGGVFVYRVKHAEAEKLAQTLSGIAGDNKNKSGGGGGGNSGGSSGNPPPVGFLPPEGGDGAAMFGSEVKITADKPTNSLIVTASKQDFEVVKGILAKIDVPRDQIFVEAIIMDLNTDRTNSWSIDVLNLTPDAQGNAGVGRQGFRSVGINEILNPTGDRGAVLAFGGGREVTINIPGLPAVKVPSLVGFIKLLTTTTDSNVLSTPKITAMNNEEAEIEVGARVPVANNPVLVPGFGGGLPGQPGGGMGGFPGGIQFEDASIKLKLTPFISPDDLTVRMKVEQSVSEVIPTPVEASAANVAQNANSLSKRSIKTNLSVQSGDTAVLGGLIRDEDKVEVTKVPILGDIPVLGWLFKSQRVTKKKRNLVVFLTPRILRTTADSHANIERELSKRLDYIKDANRGVDPFGKAVENLPRVGANKPTQDADSQPEQTDQVIDETMKTF